MKNVMGYGTLLWTGTFVGCSFTRCVVSLYEHGQRSPPSTAVVQFSSLPGTRFNSAGMVTCI